MEAEARALLANALLASAPDTEVRGPAEIRGRWKGKFTTDEILEMTRGEA